MSIPFKISNPFVRLLYFFLLFISISCSSLSKKQGAYPDYYPTGILKNVSVYQDGILDGIQREYDEQGILKFATEYKEGKVDGMRNSYYPSGAMWRKEVYQSDTLIKRTEFDEEGLIVSVENL